MRTNRQILIRAGLILVLTAALAAPTKVLAGFILVTNESDLGANDSVNWSGLGPVNLIDGVAKFTINSVAGIPVNSTVNDRSADYFQADPTDSFGKTQLNGSPAIVNSAFFNSGSDPGIGTFVTITFFFGPSVSAAGADIDALVKDAEFFENTGDYITVTGADGSTQTFSFNRTEANSELTGFYGISSDTTTIRSLEFEVANDETIVGGGVSLTIGTLDLKDSPAVSTPEPASLTLAGIGFAGLLAAAWRRRKQPAA